MPNQLLRERLRAESCCGPKKGICFLFLSPSPAGWQRKRNLWQPPRVDERRGSIFHNHQTSVVSDRRMRGAWYPAKLHIVPRGQVPSSVKNKTRFHGHRYANIHTIRGGPRAGEVISQNVSFGSISIKPASGVVRCNRPRGGRKQALLFP